MDREIRLQVLGSLAIVDAHADRTELSLPKSANGRRLLAILALEPRVHSRKSVMQLLWPDDDLDDYDTEQAVRGRFKRVIQQARKSLGPAQPCLVTEPGVDTIQLIAKSDLLEIDYTKEMEFRGEDRLREALALHRGPVLDGWNNGWLAHHRTQQTTTVRRLLGFEYGLEGDTLDRSVEDFLRVGGEDWVRHAETRIQGVRDSEAELVERVAEAVKQLAGPRPAYPWKVEDDGKDTFDLVIGSDERHVSVPLDRSAVNLLAPEVGAEEVVLTSLTGLPDEASGRVGPSVP